MMKQHIACLSSLILGLSVKGLVVEEIGDFDQHSHPMGPFEITRYPHYEQIKESIKQQDGSIDYTLYINQLPEEDEGSEHLTDLPDELQQLQQQLLEASRVPVHSHEIEVDNSTGWPWYMATIPPGDFYDCLFLYFSCTDYEKPEWPQNKEKCTNLFDYCLTYTEKNANSTDPKEPFVTKIPISSEIISSSSRPSVSSSTTTTSNISQKPIKPSTTTQQTVSVETSPSSEPAITSKPQSSTSEKTEISTEQTTTSGQIISSSETPELTPGPDTPVSESSSSESSSLEKPSPETPFSEAPSSEKPSSEAPSSLTPSSEISSSETAPTEKPSSEIPSSETPSSEKPSPETASSETPSSETPSSETPSSEKPSPETASSETPSSETPSSETSSSETPSSETSTSEKPFSEINSSETSSSGKPAPETPSSEKPTSTETSSEGGQSSTDVLSSSVQATTEEPTTVKAEIQNAIISGLPLPPATPRKKPASCSDLYELKGIRKSGTYPILVSGKNITVFCDMETDGGGWTVLQRRGDFGTPEDYFLKKWVDYKDGFGKPEEDHWIGLTYWNNITLSSPQQLLIEMEDWFGNKTQLAVNNFIIGTEKFKFRIIYASVDGEWGESLPKKGTKFSTLDNDNDAWRNNCASRFKGAWWYSACHNSNLNGLYLKGEHESFGNGVNWYHWTGYHYSLKKTEMKVRVQSQALSLGFLDKPKSRK